MLLLCTPPSTTHHTTRRPTFLLLLLLAVGTLRWQAVRIADRALGAHILLRLPPARLPGG